MEKRILLAVIPVVIVATAALLLVFNPFTPSETQTAEDKPRGLRLTWKRNDVAHTMAVTWKTNRSDSGDTVLYDTVSRNGDPDLYSYSTQGINHNFSGNYGGEEGLNISYPVIIHEVELTGLFPNTTYYFICGGEEGGWSGERAFKTAPLTRSNVRFVAGGDNRDGPEERDKISQTMSQYDPDFVLHNGDIVNRGYRQDQWDDFFNHTDAYFVGSNNLTLPIIPCIGNHETPYWQYLAQFALPHNELWYSLDWGPDIHIIVLTSENYPTSKSWTDQVTWLERDLQIHRYFPWKIVMFHKNVFYAGHPELDEAFTYGWVALFDKYHVDLVINGHSHNYWRTNPINYTDSNPDPTLPPSAPDNTYNKTQPFYENGTMYIVTGGWGAPLRYFTPGGWWTAYNRTLYNFVVVDIFQNGTLYLQAKNDTGETFDEAWIHKTLPQTIGMELAGPPTEKTHKPTNPASREHAPKAATWNLGSTNPFVMSFAGVTFAHDDLRRRVKLIRRRLMLHSKLKRV